MVVVSNGVWTYNCTYCGGAFNTKVSCEGAKTHVCPKRKCKLEHDRKRMAEKRAGVKSMSWDEIIDRFEPGEVIADFLAKVSGGRFTAGGGAQVTLTVPMYEKHKLVDLTDYSDIEVEVVIRRGKDSSHPWDDIESGDRDRDDDEA